MAPPQGTFKHLHNYKKLFNQFVRVCYFFQPAWKTRQQMDLSTPKGIRSFALVNICKIERNVLNHCCSAVLMFIMVDPFPVNSTAQWRTVRCRTLPTGGSLMSSITSKQQGLRSKPQLFKIRLVSSSAVKSCHAV